VAAGYHRELAPKRSEAAVPCGAAAGRESVQRWSPARPHLATPCRERGREREGEKKRVIQSNPATEVRKGSSHQHATRVSQQRVREIGYVVTVLPVVRVPEPAMPLSPRVRKPASFSPDLMPQRRASAESPGRAESTIGSRKCS